MRERVQAEVPRNVMAITSVSIYFAIAAASVKVLSARKIEEFSSFEISKLGAIYVAVYCIVIQVFAIFIPGSAFMEQVCDPQDKFCGLRRLAIESGLRIWGVAALLDAVDVMRPKKDRFFRSSSVSITSIAFLNCRR